MDESILVRHGESAFSIRGAVNGDPATPCPLTERGREQARCVGELLRDERIDLCVTSQFERTKETADIALAGRGVPRLELPDLNDVRVGRLEGAPLESLRAWIRDHGPAAVPPGGGESRVQTVLRYVRAFRTIVARPEPIIIIVGHGLPIHCALACAKGSPPPMFIDQTMYGAPYRLKTLDLSNAADRLEEWANEVAGPLGRTQAGGTTSAHSRPT